MPRIVGIDLDNTVIRYDRVALRVAVELGLVPDGALLDVQSVRNAIRSSGHGDEGWQRVQAEIYGPRISEADPAEGVVEFLELCRERGKPVAVVSHKTRFSNLSRRGADLRECATRWLEENGFFRPEGPGLHRSNIFFESSQAEKLGRIGALGCSHFVDDLSELFSDVAFPAGVTKLLYAPAGAAHKPAGTLAFRHWNEISDYFFAAKD